MKPLTVDEVAKRLGRHPENIRELLRDGRLLGTKPLRDWFVTEREVARFLKNGPRARTGDR